MVTGSDITVVIPSLPERSEWLERAVRSVGRQSAQPAHVIVEVDEKHKGAAQTRNLALQQVTTAWVAFLDDDDQMGRNHLQTRITAANQTGADLIYNYPRPDKPHAQFNLIACKKGVQCTALNIPWGPQARDHFDARIGKHCTYCGGLRDSFIMVTNLVRMELVDKIGGFPEGGTMGRDFLGCDAEDYLFLLALLDVGADFYHTVGERTWTYHIK